MSRNISPPFTKKYRYKPLSQISNSIRMLKLHPGLDDELLSGKLLQTDLSNSFEWEALSYVWGNPARRFPLKLGNSILLVTESLDTALRHLRHENQPRLLWVDAICINQDDLKERSAQVQKMGSIYKAALSVVIWLGPDYEGQAAARFASLDTAVWLKTPEKIQEARYAMQRILKCEWFERLWVVQEAFMARRATINWGDATMEYSHFQEHARTYNQQGPHNQPMWVGEMLQTRTIMHSLDWTRGMKCSDDRDRLYAILGLPYSTTWSPEAARVIATIRPDYTKSATEIYYDFAVACITNRLSHKLWLFTNHHVAWDPLHSDLPSWAPDLAHATLPFKTPRSMPDDIEQRDVMYRSSSIQPRLDEGDATGRTLVVTGRILGYVFYVESQCIGGGSPMQSIHNIASFWMSCVWGFRRFPLWPRLRARKRDYSFLKTLISCALPFEDDMTYAAPIVESLFDWEAVSTRFLTGHSAAKKSMNRLRQSFFSVHPRQSQKLQGSTAKLSLADAYEHVRPVWQCHRLYTTQYGEIGLGPVAMKEFDFVAIISGTKHPVILRPHDGCYFLVGNTYVSGTSDWECEKKGKKIWNRSPLQTFRIR